MNEISEKDLKLAIKMHSHLKRRARGSLKYEFRGDVELMMELLEIVREYEKSK